MNIKPLLCGVLTGIISLSLSCSEGSLEDKERIKILESQVAELLKDAKRNQDDPSATLYPIPPDTCIGTGVGDICTVAGNGIAGFNSDDISARAAALYSPQDVYVNPVNKNLYIVDFNNHRIRKIDSGSFKISTVMGSGFLGDKPLLATDPMLPGDKINLNHPTDLTFSDKGHLILAAWHNWKVKYLDRNGQVGVLVGQKTNSFSGDDGPGKEAHLNFASSVVYDFEGNLFISDQGNRRIRKLDKQGIITTFAGTGEQGFAGDGGPALQAQFNLPAGSDAIPSGKLALHPHGDKLYIADTFNHRIRVIDLKTGIINTVAGSGESGFSGDGAQATQAQLNLPVDVEVAEDHSIYFTDTGNHVVRKIDPSGVISTVAGNGKAGFSGDGESATDASLNQPGGIFIDNEYLYIADTVNHRIRRVTLFQNPDHKITLASATYSNQCSSCHGASGEGGSGIKFQGSFNCDSFESLQASIEEQMPRHNPDECKGLCSRDMAYYLLSAFNDANCD